MDPRKVTLQLLFFCFVVTFSIFRSRHFWEHITATFTPSDWIENYRVSQDTFVYLCSKLKSRIERQNTHMRSAITVEHRVAIALWCLATCSEYRTIGHLFGVARSTVCVIVHDTCAAIVNVLLTEYIQFPTGNELTSVINGFRTKCNVPQCAGAVDGCHIPVRPPANNHTDYYNRKGWYSVLLQAVVDHKYVFRDVVVGWPGSAHDARVFSNSNLYRKANNRTILNTNSISILNTNVFPFLVADSAYPLDTWLMKPFPHNSALTSGQRNFNLLICRARIVTENAFGRLKARWRRLLKQNDMSINHVPQVVLACCILNNVCEIHGETFLSSWMDDLSTDQQPVSTPFRSSSLNADAVNIRNKLVQYMV